MTTEDSDFIAAIKAAPNDDELLLVYADWLEERDDPRGTWIRLIIDLATTSFRGVRLYLLKQRVRKAAENLDSEWKLLIARAVIENCSLRFDLECPKKWENLALTEKEQERFCEVCQKRVYYCTTIGEARSHSQAGHCVVVDSTLTQTAGSDPFRTTHHDLLNRDRWQWEGSCRII